MAIIQNLYLDQGSTFSVNLDYIDSTKNPVDISGFLSRAYFKSSYSTANSYIFTSNVIDASNGIINLSMPYNETANVKAGRYVYDVEIYNGIIVTKIFEGLVVVNPEVTKNG
jgi:hypothetical protein